MGERQYLGERHCLGKRQRHGERQRIRERQRLGERRRVGSVLIIAEKACNKLISKLSLTNYYYYLIDF
jgi:hypothetical protein